MISLWNTLLEMLKGIRPPFFMGLSLYQIGIFYWKGIYEGSVTSRAASIAFSFFLALFPGVIFIFTLIPFIPIEGFQAELFVLLKQILPPTSFDATYSTVNDILTVQRGNLLGFTVVAALFFATNGTLSLISNFTQTIHKVDLRTFWSQYFAALVLTLALSFLLLIGIGLLILSDGVVQWIAQKDIAISTDWITLSAWRYLILFGIILLAVSLLFKYGPSSKAPWQLVSPGSLLATLLVLGTSYLFGYYVSHFSTYNQLYGSIGTLMVIQLWIYVNAIGLIMGYELDASVAGAKASSQTK